MSNLVEIEVQEYQDCHRFGFLFEYYSGDSYRNSIVADCLKETHEVILIDDHRMGSDEKFLNFHA